MARRTRWIVRPALVAAVMALVATVGGAGGASVAGAAVGDLPPGFTDGVPVGGPDGQGEASTDAGHAGGAETEATTNAVTERYFGEEPWNSIEAAAADTDRSCSLADDDLTAMAVSPIFKESSAATSPDKTPAPMTLSRFDEWNGTLNDDTNRNANYGLYAFRNPNTPYQRAFWHPGIGIWQYDSSGVGGPFTAIERMDVSIVGADVTAGMAGRYCSPSPSLIGHGAPFTDQERRYAAWSPWGYPCTACEQLFQDMTGSDPDFENVTLVPGITDTGGAVQRTCSLVGVAETLPCWYVDPSVGVIQGATSWATLDPTGGGNPTVAPTPLAEAFYVVDRGATEERHWLKADTGYSIDISGTRNIGKNDRPRTGQPGTGVTWASSSGLCDLTTGRGACVPLPPAGVTSTLAPINATYRPIPLDAQGDGKGDILWYSPGSAPDFLWSGQGSGAYASTQLAVNSTYDDVLPLDMEGDGDDDLLWYRRSTGAAYLWKSNGNGTWTTTAIPPVTKNLRPLIVDTDGDESEEIFWYGPGSVADSLMGWTGAGGSVGFVTNQSVSGSYAPFTGDFDGDGRIDIYWYAPGSAGDTIWFHTGLGAHASVSRNVSGIYLPQVGDYDDDERDDIIWYAPGSAADAIWFANPGRTFVAAGVSLGGTYKPVVADIEGDGRDDVLWYAPGPTGDTWWRWDSNRVRVSESLPAHGTHQAVVGAFSEGGTDGVFWYAPGSTPDATWWH